jgi:hypothetical protein
VYSEAINANGFTVKAAECERLQIAVRYFQKKLYRILCTIYSALEASQDGPLKDGL